MSGNDPLHPLEVQQFQYKRDYTELLHMEINRFDQPMSKMLLDFLLKKYSNEYNFVIDVSGNGIIDAYVISGIEHKTNLHIFSIAVKQTFEGQGWATKLLEYLIEKAKKSGLEKIILEVNEENSRAIKLYNTFMFKQTGYEEEYYGSGTKAIKMELDLL